MELKKLTDEHITVTAQLKTLTDEHQGEGKSWTDDARVKRSALIDQLDKLEPQLKTAIEDMEAENRTKAALEFGQKGGSHVPFDGDHTVNRKGYDGPIELKGGFWGAEVKGTWTPVYPEAYINGQDEGPQAPTHIKASLKPEYKAAFSRYLRSHGDIALLPPDHVKALVEGRDSDGGFAVPADFIARVIQREPGLAIVEDQATMLTTTRDRVEVPRIAAATTDPTMYSSAVKFTMVAEIPSSEGVGETEPAFEMVGINVHTAKMETFLSRNFIADSAFAVETWLANEFRRAATLGKDDKFLTGSGVNEPIGIVNDAGITSVDSGSDTNITADGVKDWIYDLAAQYHQGASIALSLSALKAIRKLKDGENRYLWDAGNGGLVGGIPPTIEGFPYRVTDFLDTAFTDLNIPAIFGQFRHFWVVNRMDLSMQVLKEVKARQNQDGFLGFLRFTGAVTVPEAFRLLRVHLA